MRLKTLLMYNFMTIKQAVIIFYSFFMAGTLFGSVISIVAGGTIGVNSTNSEGATYSWSSSIIAFGIFMIISSLICSQKETRFLITRSVSRKEIFLSNAIFLIPLAAIMSVLQIISIIIDSAVRAVLSGGAFRGLELDIQNLQAPDMDNIFVFFLVSVSVMVCIGAASYLIGSFMARWKLQTVGALIVLGIVFIACMVLPDFLKWIIDAFKFLFTDKKSGLLIVLKQILLAALIMVAAFPVMRKITAVKQSQ